MGSARDPTRARSTEVELKEREKKKKKKKRTRKKKKWLSTESTDTNGRVMGRPLF